MMIMEVIRERETPLNAPGPEDKQVRFARKVQVRPIPSANQGRRCDNKARKKLQGKRTKGAVKVEASQEDPERSEESNKTQYDGQTSSITAKVIVSA